VKIVKYLEYLANVYSTIAGNVVYLYCGWHWTYYYWIMQVELDFNLLWHKFVLFFFVCAISFLMFLMYLVYDFHNKYIAVNVKIASCV